jgi:hypothetical protein
LAFLDVHNPFAHGSGYDQIGLAAEKCRNLKNVSHFGNLRDIGSLVDIGQHGYVNFIFHFLENA